MQATRDSRFGCVIADGRRDRDGYVFWGTTRAHLKIWRDTHGVLADGLELDHLCRNRACVALHHLEPVTRVENERRKRWRYRVTRARCAAGHDLSIHRVVTPTHGIVCRACNQIHASDPLPF